MAALYAFALQLVLGGAWLAGHHSADRGLVHILCAPDASDSGDPAPSPLAHGHLPCCCQAAHMLTSLPAPEPDHALVAWPQERVARIAWRPEIAALPRAPPNTRPSARAPPVV